MRREAGLEGRAAKQQAFEQRGADDAGKNAASLRDGAEKLEDQGNESLGRDRQVDTHRRAGMAQSAMDEARRLIAVAGTMRRVADALEAGDAPLLAHVKNRAQVEALLGLLRTGKVYSGRSKGERWQETDARPYDESDVSFARYPWPQVTGYTVRDTIAKLEATRGGKKLAGQLKDQYRGISESVTFAWASGLDLCSKITSLLGKDAPKEFTEQLRDCNRMRNLGIETPDQLTDALRQFLPCVSAKKREDPIKAAELKLAGTKIPGYFPTPRALVDRMLDDADIEPGMSVLEPSAGKGNIADAAKERGADVTTIEPNGTLRDILQAKGHKDAGRDFLEHSGQYDRVIMNPPFEAGQDMQHVQHAYEQLKPGGKLVAIMSEGPFFRDDAKAKGFRSWLEQHDGVSEKLPDGSFAGKDAERSTGVATRLVTITKPDTPESPAVQPASTPEVAPEEPPKSNSLADALRASAAHYRGLADQHSGTVSRLNYEANPAGDVGGIRGRDPVAVSEAERPEYGFDGEARGLRGEGA